MTFCEKCGKELEEGGCFCGYCGNDTRISYDPDRKKKRVSSALAYVGILFFLPLAICPDSKYGRFHANQGLVLFIVDMIVGVVGAVFAVIFTMMFVSEAYTYDIAIDSGMMIAGIIGMIISYLFLMGAGIFLLVIRIMGIVNGATGKEKKLPLIGRFRLIK